MLWLSSGEKRCEAYWTLEGGMADKGRGGVSRSRPGFVDYDRSPLALAAGLFEVVDDGGIGEGRDIPKIVLALGHAAQYAAHDLAAPRLRQVGGEDDLFGPRVGAYGLPYLVVELLDKLVGTLSVAFQDHVGYDSLA